MAIRPGPFSAFTCKMCGQAVLKTQADDHECNQSQIEAHQLSKFNKWLSSAEKDFEAYAKTNRGQFLLFLIETKRI